MYWILNKDKLDKPEVKVPEVVQVVNEEEKKLDNDEAQASKPVKLKKKKLSKPQVS